MGRPLKQGLDFFPHDLDLSSDEKIEALRSLFGNDGYAFYCILLERIYRTEDGELDISDPETRRVLAKKIGVSVRKFEEILRVSLKYHCFDAEIHRNNDVLTSSAIKKRFYQITGKRAKSRGSYRVSEAETPPETPPETLVSGTQVKESKVKRSKEKENKEKDPAIAEFLTQSQNSNQTQTQNPASEPEKPPLEPEKPPAKEKPPRHAVDEAGKVFLSSEELFKLEAEVGKNAAKYLIESASDFAKQKPQKWATYRDHLAFLRNSERRLRQDGKVFFHDPMDGPGYYPDWKAKNFFKDQREKQNRA